MELGKRVLYMAFGAMLALGIAIGGIAVFAQDDDSAEVTPAPEVEAESDVVPLPGFRSQRERIDGLRGDDEERLAAALGITVEELAAAEDEAYAAAIDQAVAEGLLTEAQAEQLLEGNGRFRHPFIGSADREALLADALGISVEQLQSAMAEVRAARLAELVESGALTQEQADLMAARAAVQDYVDQEALAETLQNAYEAAVDAALADGAITAAQAEQLLENMPAFDRFDFGSAFGGGPGRGHHHGGFRMPGGAAPDTATTVPASALDA
jgi:hypothetical protein